MAQEPQSNLMVFTTLWLSMQEKSNAIIIYKFIIISKVSLSSILVSFWNIREGQKKYKTRWEQSETFSGDVHKSFRFSKRHSTFGNIQRFFKISSKFMNQSKTSKTHNVKANLFFALKRSAMSRISLFVENQTMKRKQIYKPDSRKFFISDLKYFTSKLNSGQKLFLKFLKTQGFSLNCLFLILNLIRN